MGRAELARMRAYLAFAHLPPRLQALSKPCSDLVDALVAVAEDGFEDVDWDEFAHGVRKLVEAKDCFVRAVVRGRPVK